MRSTLSAPRRSDSEAPNPRADPLPRHRTPAASRRICAHDFCKKGTSVNRKCLVFARAFPSFQDIRAQQDCKRLAANLQMTCGRLAGRCLPETKKLRKRINASAADKTGACKFSPVRASLRPPSLPSCGCRSASLSSDCLRAERPKPAARNCPPTTDFPSDIGASSAFRRQHTTKL